MNHRDILTSQVQAHARAGYSPSGLAAIIRHGEVLEYATWGNDGYSLDSPFRIASLTKSFTALAILSLRRAGLLNLDDPVRAHLPETQVDAPADWPELRLRHLLAMSSGLATDNPWGDRQESLSRAELSSLAASGLRLLFPPGTAFEYSNLGYALLGEVISRVSGSDYREFVLQQIITPLGLTRTRFSAAELDSVLPAWHREPPLPGQPGGWTVQEPSGPGAFSSIGGLWSTVSDLARWTDLFQRRDVPAGVRFTAADLIEAQQPLSFAGTNLAEVPLHGPAAAGYGFGLVIENYAEHGRIIGHSGGYPGFTSNMSWHEDSGLTVITSTNGTHSAATKLARQLIARLVAASPRTQEYAEPWPETVQAVAALTDLVSGGAVPADLFADNVEADFPLARRSDHLQQALVTLGSFREATAPVHARPSRARWQALFESGLLELDIELAPVRPFGVQTFSVTMERASNRIKLF